MSLNMKYNIVVCGGTFDHFHKGHREFLRYGLSIGKKLLLGLTTDKYIRHKKLNNSIESYEKRKDSIEKFLKSEKALERVEIEPIEDIYIPKVWESLLIEAIIVSKNTIENAKKINLERQEHKKYPLVVKTFPLVKNNNNEYISSSKIRNGTMDREGKPYLYPLWLKHNLKITKTLRRKLKKPFGELIRNEKNIKSLKYSHLITVGDVATSTFNKLGFRQDTSIIDFRVARKRIFSSIHDLGFLGKEEVVKANNPSGYLTADLFQVASNLFRYPKDKQKVILIEGEEDLSVLPLILVSPLNSAIFYGQPNEGIVKVEVSEETKDKAYSIVNKFSVCTRGH